jgi:hypothetical protein
MNDVARLKVVQDCVAAYFQPSPFDKLRARSAGLGRPFKSNPGLASLAKFSQTLKQSWKKLIWTRLELGSRSPGAPDCSDLPGCCVSAEELVSAIGLKA